MIAHRPEIPGYRFTSEIAGGAGGFATVYRYLHLVLERHVAIKVLNATLDDAGRERFLNEARAMVIGDNHPHIVAILDTGVTTDGRGYLVMPYYRQNLADRVRQERLAAPDALRVGILVASAVQAAHNIGLLHRDIKPANILLDNNDLPRLADFGIAGRAADTDGVGMSVPWSPPEVLRGEPNSVASDVYSLAATVWHLLVGHAPFAEPGDGSPDALERRILTGPAPRTGVPGVPDLCEHVLAGALNPRAELRPSSAREFARHLQRVQVTLGLDRTEGVWTAETADPAAGPGQVLEYSRTVLRTSRREPPPAPGSTVFRQFRPPQQPPRSSTVPRAKPGTSSAPVPVPLAHTEIRVRPPVDPAPEPAPKPRRRLPVLLAGGAVAAVAVVVAVLLGSGDQAAPAQAAPPVVVGQDAGGGGVELPPGPPTVTATTLDKGRVRFAWTYSATLATDTFSWRTSDSTRTGVVRQPSVVLTAPSTGRFCVQVKVVRADGSNAATDWSAPGCLR